MDISKAQYSKSLAQRTLVSSPIVTNEYSFNENPINHDLERLDITFYVQTAVKLKLFCNHFLNRCSSPNYIDLSFSGKGVTVVVGDDGLEHTHPDLKENYRKRLINGILGFIYSFI